MCFLGPAPAVVIALATVSAAAVRRMPPLPLLLHNVANYATLPLVGGLLVRLALNAGASRTEDTFALVVCVVYWTTIFLSFGLIALSERLLHARSIRETVPPVTLGTNTVPSAATAAFSGPSPTGIVATSLGSISCPAPACWPPASRARSTPG